MISIDTALVGTGLRLLNDFFKSSIILKEQCFNNEHEPFLGPGAVIDQSIDGLARGEVLHNVAVHELGLLHRHVLSIQPGCWF